MNHEEPTLEVVGSATELIQTKTGGSGDGGNLGHSLSMMLSALEEE